MGLAGAAALPMETHGETMGFVADLLDQMQDRGVSFQNDRFVLLAEDVENFFFFGDAGHRLIDDLQGFERLRGGVQLPQPAVDENQAGKQLLFFLQTAIPANHCFIHAGEVVVLRARTSFGSFIAPDDELAVLGFFHAAVFPNDHGRDRIRALDVRYVEAFDALGLFGQIQRGLQGFANGAGRGLEDAETLFEGMFGIVFHQIEKGALAASLRSENFHFVPGTFAEQYFQQLAVLEIDRDVNHFREIFGFEIELLEERGDKFVGIEFVQVLPVEFAAVHHAPGAQVTWDSFKSLLQHDFLARFGENDAPVVLADTGFSFYGLSNLKVAESGFVGQLAWGAIGYTVAANYGVKLANETTGRKRRAVSVVGDAAFAQTVNALVAGQQVGTMNLDGSQVPLKLQVQDRYRSDPEGLPSPSGSPRSSRHRRKSLAAILGARRF